MNILPSKTFTLRTAATLAQVKQRLANHVEEPKLVRWYFSHDHAPYQGTISNSGFEIRRIIHYRNSFLPNIQGRFTSLPRGTAVHVTMQLHPLVLVFMCVWLGIWYMGVMPITLFGDVSPLMGIVFWVAPVLAFSIFLGAFYYEAERSHRDLTHIVGGYELPQGQQQMSRLARNLMWGYVAIVIAIFLHHLLTS